MNATERKNRLVQVDRDIAALQAEKDALRADAAKYVPLKAGDVAISDDPDGCGVIRIITKTYFQNGRYVLESVSINGRRMDTIGQDRFEAYGYRKIGTLADFINDNTTDRLEAYGYVLD
jgi:hypothetical protein